MEQENSVLVQKMGDNLRAWSLMKKSDGQYMASASRNYFTVYHIILFLSSHPSD